jgi:two-component system, chemotaxis family, sensor kinase CheA
MKTKEEEFLERLQSMFVIEALEHINVLSCGLMELEKKPVKARLIELVEIIFREAHSLKGAARSVNRNDIESICQILESVFAKLKNELLTFSASQFDLLHQSIDILSKLVSGNETNIDNSSNELLEQLQLKILTGEPAKNKVLQSNSIQKKTRTKSTDPASVFDRPAQSELLLEKTFNPDTVRIQTAKLGMLFLEAEQMIQSKVTSSQRLKELTDIYNSVQSLKSELKKWHVLHNINIDAAIKDLNSNRIETLQNIESKILELSHALESDQRSMGRMIDEHLESLKKVLMLPVSTVFEVLPRLVRDLARGQGKEVELQIQGGEVEVDKRILEELKDPLIHIIRNCIDHGIQKPSERGKMNKPSAGTISVNSVIIDGHNVEITITDDGTGIEIEKVVAASIRSGVISKEKAINLGIQESLELIFKSGITTSPIITDLSGRGLGLAIVREKVEKLGGKVSVESQLKTGTTFRIILPISLSTFRGILVRSADTFFFVPTINVERVIRLSREKIKTVENQETISLDKKIIRTIKLSEALGLNGSNKTHVLQRNKNYPTSNLLRILVLTHAEMKVGFVVDEIEDEQQILVKELGKQLKRVRNISGATVLGSGKVVPVLNVADLMKASMNFISVTAETDEYLQKGTKIYRILIADDSITARSLIKNILESAGYEVITAVDGVDAFTKVAVGEFDLIVSDVDMPRMNGFELTAKIRKEKKISELPVVLVTALESDADREHGIDVGANAYIIKSSFDQSNLLDVIHKLM